MSAGLGRVVRTGVGRRRVQTVVVTLTALLAVTASVLAVGLLVASSAPFRRAFEAQRGAHLIAQFDGAAVSAAQLVETAKVAGVTASAGPFASVSLRPRTVSVKQAPGVPFKLQPGLDLPPMVIAGRADAGGDVDQLVLTAGRWATAPGELVLAAGGVPFVVPGCARQPDPDGGGHGPVDRFQRTGVGDAGPADRTHRAADTGDIRDAVPVRPRGHRCRHHR
jgi:putative ABC transport system permease protein